MELETMSQGTDPRTSTTILRLPTEILEQIVDDVEASCLANLRATCRGFCTVASKPFGRRCLAHRRFMMSKQSLQALVELTAHPIFGPCVQTVLLSTHDIAQDLQNLLESSPHGESVDERTAKFKHIRQIQDEHNEFVGSNQHIALLTQAMDNLHQYGTKVTYGVFDELFNERKAQYEFEQDSLIRKCYGWEKFWSDVLPSSGLGLKWWIAEPDVVLQALKVAAERSGGSLSKLELDIGNALTTDDSLNDTLYKLTSTKDDKGQTTDRNLDICVKLGGRQELRLSRIHETSCYHTLSFRGKVHDRLPGEGSFQQPVSRDPNNQILYYDYGFGNCPFFHASSYGSIHDVLIRKNLREIHLKSCAVALDYLFALLTGQGAELYRLQLVDLRITSSFMDGNLDWSIDPWPFMSNFLSVLEEHLELHSLVVEQISLYDQYHPNTLQPVVVIDDRHEWNGVEEIRSGFKGFIEESRGQDL